LALTAPSSSAERLLIHSARQLLTLRGPSTPRRGPDLGDLAIIPDGAVLIEGQTIAEIGSSRRVVNLAAAKKAEVLDAGACVVMPGFVDSHTHLLTGAPGRTAHALPAGRLIHHARRTIGICVRHGTTTLESKTGLGPNVSAEMKSLRALAALDQKPLDVLATVLAGRGIPAEWQSRESAYLDWFAWDVLPKVKARGLARFVDLDTEAAGVSGAVVERFLQAALALGFPIRVHSGDAALARKLGAASVDLRSPREGRILAGSSVVATLLPFEAFADGGGRKSARGLVEDGVAPDFNGFRPASLLKLLKTKGRISFSRCSA